MLLIRRKEEVMKATLRFLRISARKTRLVADIVAVKVLRMQFTLSVTRRAASEPIASLLRVQKPMLRMERRHTDNFTLKRSM